MDAKELRAYLERCDEALFQSPRDGISMAQHGPDLARQAGNRELEALALAVTAGGLRMLGNHESSEQHYQEALALAPHCSPVTLADIRRRLAVLRFSQGRFLEGIQLASGAEEVFHKANRPNDEARAKVTRGNLYCEGFMQGQPDWLKPAVQDFTAALKLVDIRTAPRVALGALQGFVIAIAESPAPRLTDLEAGINAITHYRTEPHTVPHAKLLWARGLITRSLGAWTRAEKLLTLARDELARLGLPVDTALVSLDLGGLFYLYPDNDRWTKLGEVATHATMLFRGRLPAEMLAALALWRDAIVHQDLTNDLSHKIRRTIATGDPRFLRTTTGLADGRKMGGATSNNAAALLPFRERDLTRLALSPAHPPGPPRKWNGRLLNRVRLEPSDAIALEKIATELGGSSRAEATRVAIREYAASLEQKRSEQERKRWEAPKKPKPWEGLE